MLIYACYVLPVVTVQYLGTVNMWLAVTVIGFAMAAHQAWCANIFTKVSDMFPKNATASETGIGGMFGAVGGILIAKSAGMLFDHYNSIGDSQTGYLIMFLICGFVYLISWILMHLLMPKMKKITYQTSTNAYII